MARKTRINDRYELQDVIGRGGMGVVYRAWDAVVKREVAVKTIRDLPSPRAFDLFRKECGVMAGMSHPNIVEIFDIGEFEENGSLKPFLVMPLLGGATLDQLIRSSTQRLTVDRSIDIICQICRGLQSAHERGLIHRDLKPSNIFVMPDHSVKVIDFGLAHMADTRTSLSVRGGTLLYMAPEQLEMKPATALSDIFSLGVVFYEMLTCRRPFEPAEASTEQEVIDAIIHHSPVPVSELNPEVNQVVSRVVHKALAKQPWNRFKSARELSESLQKAQRNEPVFDDAAIEPRVQRAIKAFEKENYQFASEVLNELEAEGHLHPAVPALRRQIDQAVHQRQVTQLLDSARNCFQEEEYLLALQKLQEVLQMDKNNSNALALKATVENRLSEQKVEQWLRLARQHLEHNAFSLAREALQNLLQVRPKEASAVQFLAEVDRREQQYVQARKEKNQLYEAAVEAWKHGEMSAALSKMERLIDLDRQVPDVSSSERAVSYQSFYNEIRSEYDASRGAYQEARRNLVDGHFNTTLEICNQYLAKYPSHALFQALKFDVEERQRQQLSARIAEINRSVEIEPDLDRRVNILKEALEQYPGEAHFERALRLMRDRRDLVASIVNKARSYEDRGSFNEALGQWETLETIHQQYPGLQFEIERLVKRRDQQARVEAKTRWVDQIDRQLECGDYARALELIRNATAEFPGDTELATLERLALQGQAQDVESRRLLAEGQELCAAGRTAQGLSVLQKANELDPRNVAIRTAYVNALLEEGRAKLDRDWSSAEVLISQALAIDPSHPLGRSLQTLVLDRKSEESVALCVTEARELQARGDDKGALERVERGLESHPQDQRLQQLKLRLQRSVSDIKSHAAAASSSTQALAQKQPDAHVENPPIGTLEQAKAARNEESEVARAADLQELRSFWDDHFTQDSELFGARLKKAEAIGQRHPDDEEVRGLLTDIRTRATETLVPHPAPEPPTSIKVVVSPLTKVREQIRKVLHRLPAGSVPAMVSRYWREWAVGAGVAATLILPLIWFLTRPAELHIRTLPAGATIRINGQLRGRSDVKQKLPPGLYAIEVSQDGYISKSLMVALRRGHLEERQIDLQPVAEVTTPPVELHQSLQIMSGQPGKVYLDDQPAVDFQEGQFTVNSLPWGSHGMKIVCDRNQTEFSFQTGQNTIATLTNSLKSGDQLVLFVATMGNQARVYSNSLTAKVLLKGETKGELQSGMMDLSGLDSGSYELTLEAGLKKGTVNFTIGAAASLVISITEQNTGSVRISTGTEGVTVFLDGNRRSRQTNARGELPIPSVEPGSHTITVGKEGYKTPDPQTILVEKGKLAKAEFHLQPLPTKAALVLRDFPLGAQVTLDKTPLGSINSEGILQASDITPVEHEIGISLPRFRPSSVTKRFVAGETIELTRKDFPLQSQYGFIDVTVLPGTVTNPTVTLRGPNSNPETYAAGKELLEGQYQVRAEATGYEPAAQPVTVRGGQHAPVTLTLRPKVSGPSGPSGPTGGPTIQSDWPGKAGWKKEGTWYVVPSEGPHLSTYLPLKGRIEFSVYKKRRLIGNSSVGWVINFMDRKNYVLFEIDGSKFRRTEFINGKPRSSQREIQVPSMGQDNDTSYRIRIDISGDKIVHTVQNGDNWQPVDTWSEPDRDFSRGKFGFPSDMRVTQVKFEPAR